MSEAILADLQRRLNNLVRSGVVHSVQAQPLRCRVLIGELLTDWLRCHMPAAGDVSEARLPVEGEAVQVFCESGDLRNGVVYPDCITTITRRRLLNQASTRPATLTVPW
ncbi:hypothetical protein CWR41_00535 [Cedecea lapagei]|nr:hypothetical protein CWR41_00535 [Cedecea lapagei]